MKGGKYMENKIQTFLSTFDVMRVLGIGNKTCLELFHRKDFPCVKIGRAYKISTENFKEYFKTRRVFQEENE